jgi:hypothetical protein
VESRKEGRWMFYKLPGDNSRGLAREALAWALKSLKDDPRAANDERTLQTILKQDPAELCKRQCQR